VSLWGELCWLFSSTLSADFSSCNPIAWRVFALLSPKGRPINRPRQRPNTLGSEENACMSRLLSRHVVPRKYFGNDGLPRKQFRYQCHALLLQEYNTGKEVQDILFIHDD
jgi:hypothetical protein